MIGLLCFALAVLTSPFKSKLRLEAENAVLRHQLNVLRRRPHGRVRLTNHDRLFFIQLYRWFPSILKVLTIIRPETLVRWHRAGEPSCTITRRTLPPWTCSLFRPSVSTCSMPSSSSGSAAEISSGSTSQQIRRQNGLHVKQRRHFLGIGLRTISSVIWTGSMAKLSGADCALWASGTSLPHRPRVGRMASPNG